MIKVSHPRNVLFRSDLWLAVYCLDLLAAFFLAYIKPWNELGNELLLYTSSPIRFYIISCISLLIIVAVFGFSLFSGFLIIPPVFLFGYFLSSGVFFLLTDIPTLSPVYCIILLAVFLLILLFVLSSDKTCRLSNELSCVLLSDKRLRVSVLKFIAYQTVSLLLLILLLFSLYKIVLII